MSVKVHEDVTQIEIRIVDRELAQFFDQTTEDKDKVLVDCLKIGSLALRFTQQGKDTEFVKRQLDAAVHAVEMVLSKLPDEIKGKLVDEIGPGSKVMMPIADVVAQTKAILYEKLTEVKSLLSNDIDPKSTTSVLGRALQEIKQLLDPKRDDSIQGAIVKALSDVSKADSTLILAIERVLTNQFTDLRKTVDQLSLEVRGINAAQIIVDQTALKGKEFEEEVVDLLQAWAKGHGAEAHHTGSDNKTGDVVIVDRSGDQPITIIVEAKNYTSAMGRKRITDILTEATNVRSADAGILVSKTQEGFAKEIGDWGEGQIERGPWVTTTFENLTIAVMYILAKVKIERAKKSTKEFDATAVQAQLDRMQMSLKKVRNISDKSGSIISLADGIKDEAKSIKAEIEDAVVQIEKSLAKGK